eukprot:TRINITY_DN9678_c0_g1_i1.p1 TRINITY_DN9678_c0_g1~~TRINITY_DN9678_c0_g1_i1.p1  ORF type:complete len:581 (+),score=136.92 TRINITY_DN9678_c0_g1_i1:43-1743(+)
MNNATGSPSASSSSSQSTANGNGEHTAEPFVDVKGYYTCLGFDRMDVSLEDIKKSYRRLLLQFHPDKNPDQQAAQQFILVQTAYKVLSNPQERELYNEHCLVATRAPWIYRWIGTLPDQYRPPEEAEEETVQTKPLWKDIAGLLLSVVTSNPVEYAACVLFTMSTISKLSSHQTPQILVFLALTRGYQVLAIEKIREKGSKFVFDMIRRYLYQRSWFQLIAFGAVLSNDDNENSEDEEAAEEGDNNENEEEHQNNDEGAAQTEVNGVEEEEEGRGEGDDEQEEGAGRTSEGARRLRGVVEDVKDFARLAAVQFIMATAKLYTVALFYPIRTFETYLAIDGYALLRAGPSATSDAVQSTIRDKICATSEIFGSSLSLIDFITRTFKTEGPRGFYRGLTPYLLAVGVTIMISSSLASLKEKVWLMVDRNVNELEEQQQEDERVTAERAQQGLPPVKTANGETLKTLLKCLAGLGEIGLLTIAHNILLPLFTTPLYTTSQILQVTPGTGVTGSKIVNWWREIRQRAFPPAFFERGLLATLKQVKHVTNPLWKGWLYDAGILFSYPSLLS